MTRDELQKLRLLPIEEVAERLGFEVHAHKALCPFHGDRHPSLSFHVRRNTFRCFVCDARGSTIDLVMRTLRLDFRDACRWLADGSTALAAPLPRAEERPAPKPFDAARYEPYFRQPWLSGRAKEFLYEERRISPAVVRWCRLTTWRDRQGGEWLQIPYYSPEGRLVGLQNRNLTADGPRFRFPQGSRCTIYNLPVLQRLRPGEPLYITEGSSDCWAMLSAGRKAVAIPSATLLRRDDLEILLGLHARLATPFHIYPDADAPGECLYLQLREKLPSLERHPLPPGCKDFADLWRRHQGATPG